MSINSPNREDTVWHHAVEVLCQIEFPPILAISNHSSVIGFQETLRSDYPKFSKTMTSVVLSEDPDDPPHYVPIWRLQDNDGVWRVSLGCNFIALSSNNGHFDFDEYSSRLLKALQALERTLAPGRSTWIGLRKLNYLSPTDNNPYSWHHLLCDELPGSFVEEGFNFGPNFESVTFHGKIHIHDDNNGVLTIGHGMYDEKESYYVLDLEYETTETFSMEAGDAIVRKLQSYYDSISRGFQWCIKPKMIDHIKLHNRNEAGK